MNKLWFLAFLAVSSVFGQPLPESSLADLKPDFRPIKNGELTNLFPQDFKQMPPSKIYPEFNKFKPTHVSHWNLDLTAKERVRREKEIKEKEYVMMLQRLDSTRKTEYFRRVLRSPLPESFKGDPKHNPETKQFLLFSID